MAWDATDWSINAAGDVRYIGDAHGGASPTYVEIEEWYREIRKLEAELSSTGDDLADITRADLVVRNAPGLFTMVRGNVDDTATEHLYDGSITQGSGDTRYSGVALRGTLVAGTEPQIVQNGALLTSYWGTGLNGDANNIMRLLIKTREFGMDIDGGRIIAKANEFGDTYAEFPVGLGLGEGIAFLNTLDDAFNNTAVGTVGGWTITNTEGLNAIDVDGDAITENYYSLWDPGAQSRQDAYEFTKRISRRGSVETIHGMNGQLFRGITHHWDYDAETGISPTTNDDYAWGLNIAYDNEATGPFVVGEVVTIGGTAKGRILAIDDNGVDGNLIVDMGTGTPADNDAIVGETSGATGDVNGAPVGQATGGGVARILAVVDAGTTGTAYMQILKGTAPADNAVCYEITGVGDSLTVNGPPTSKLPVSAEWFAQSTGDNLIARFGIGIVASALTSSDQLTDLADINRIPPNNITVSLSGLTATEDSFTVGPYDGIGDIDTGQLSINGALTAAATSIVTNEAIPDNTPAAGFIRLDRTGNGEFDRIAYSSRTGFTYTVDVGAHPGGIPNAIADAAESWIEYMGGVATVDPAQVVVVFGSNQTWFFRVRDSGDVNGTETKTSEGTISVTSGGGSAAFTSQSDE